MSKYSGLGEYLKRQRRDVVPMTFGEIEKITGQEATLPHPPISRMVEQQLDFNSVLTKVWLKPASKASRRA